MLTPNGVGFYSDMYAMVFGDTSISVDEVISPRFLFLSTPDPWTEAKHLLITNLKQKNYEKTLFITISDYRPDDANWCMGSIVRR